MTLARTCSICPHEARQAIDRALIEGEPIRLIAAKHQVAYSSLRRHRDTHLHAALGHALEDERIEVSADKLITWVHVLHARTLRMLAQAEHAADRNNGRGLIAEARKNLELLARIAGVLDPPTVHIDARRQVAILGRLDEDALRALASGDVIEGEAIEVEQPALVEAVEA